MRASFALYNGHEDLDRLAAERGSLVCAVELAKQRMPEVISSLRERLHALLETEAAQEVFAEQGFDAARMDEVARRGGIDSYLGAAGVTTDQLAALRARAIVF